MQVTFAEGYNADQRVLLHFFWINQATLETE